MYEIIAHYFWVLCIVVTAINAAKIKLRSLHYIKEDPTLAAGYAQLIRGYLTWLNVPWVIMGIGSTVGGVPSVLDYFQPRAGNPFVQVWYVTVILLWIVGTNWLLTRGGAELLVKYPGVFNTPISSPGMVKFLWFTSLAGGVFGVVMLWMWNIRVPLTL